MCRWAVAGLLNWKGDYHHIDEVRGIRWRPRRCLVNVCGITLPVGGVCGGVVPEIWNSRPRNLLGLVSGPVRVAGFELFL